MITAEEIHVKREIKVGEADTWCRYRAGAVRRCYHTARDVGKYSAVVKCNGGRVGESEIERVRD